MNTPLQQAAQQALETLESGALLCELTAASMLRVALADEQEQPANSRIASLYEELRKATDGGSESMTHDDALKQIAYWQDKEQAQAVEPDKISWKNLVLWYEAGANDWDSLRGIVTKMLHTHPAPPPATGERSGLANFAVECSLRPNSMGDKLLFKRIAEMLEDDGKAQQVAVPLTPEQLCAMADRCTPNTETGSLNYLRYARAIEAHHKIGAKP